MKVLWITGWYPNRTEPFAGDFVQRHAQAISSFCDVGVLHIVRTTDKEITSTVLREEFISGALEEKIVYYAVKKNYFSAVEKLASYRIFIRLVKEGIQKYIQEEGKPDVIHFYIGMRLGKVAEWVKNELNIPYVVTEQWTGFLEEAKPKFIQLPKHFQSGWKKMIRDANAVTAVSHYLGNAIKRIAGSDKPVVVIPNVVNTDLFFYEEQKEKDICRFVHICGDDYQKNSADIIKAFEELQKKNVGFELAVFGPSSNNLENLAKELNIPVHFKQEVSQMELSEYMRHSDALILYSRYETFGCVLIEANACGLPVIATDIPVIKETIEEGRNGILVEKERPEMLAQKIIEFINNRRTFNKKDISGTTSARYNYKKVGEQFFLLYQQLVNESKR